jgi:ketol-acid reductoisomerase
MKKTLAEIQDGTFAREWIRENKQGGYHFADLREKEQQHPIEIVGAQLRGMMSWLPGPQAKKGPETKKDEGKLAVNA